MIDAFELRALLEGVQDGADAALLVRELNARLGQLGLPAVDWLPDIPVPAWISAPFTPEQFERSQALFDAVCKLDLSNPQSLPPMKRAHMQCQDQCQEASG